MCFICTKSEKDTYCKDNPNEEPHHHLWVNRHNDNRYDDHDDDTYFVKF